MQRTTTARPPRAAIFDLDGVITDTAEYHYLAWQQLADEQGWAFDRAANEQLRGVSRMDSLELLLDGREASEQDKLAWATRKNDAYVALLAQVTPDDLLPGALEVLLGCKQRGLAVAIGSSSKNAPLVLERLGVTDLFDAVTDGSSVERAKPAPDLFLHAAASLGADPADCVVFEDAASGVDAALAAGMRAVGIGPAERVGHATLRADTVADIDLAAVLYPSGPPTQHLPNNLVVTSGWEVGERVLEPAQLLTTGSNYLIGNGYLGYRGTFPEWDAREYVGCIVSDTYDCADGVWTELCNAPNALQARWSVEGTPIVVAPDNPARVFDYTRELNVRYGLHARSWRHRGPGTNVVALTDERFASLDDVHILAQRQRIEVAEAGRAEVVTGIDGQVWDLNGTHFAHCESTVEGDELVMRATTGQSGVEVVVVQAVRVRGAEPAAASVASGDRRIDRTLQFELAADGPVTLETVMAVVSSNDCADPRSAALAAARAAADAGYDRLKARHAARWDARWRRLDIEIDGDLPAQTLLRYNLYQAVIATPLHTDHLPIGARGLSCQAYQGAAFWDQEVFNLPMWLYTEPQRARALLVYRHRTLDGARRKAAALGYEGAFYAWVSGLTGDELCPDYFFVDVLSGRPIRNHFNDWQIHISPDIAVTIAQYTHATGDWAFVEEHGAEMLLEIARFCASRVHLNVARDRYEIIRVLGPDEYHENVDNNAFTNHQVAAALRIALDVHSRLGRDNPDRLAELSSQLRLSEEELDRWRDILDRLYLPAPAADSGVIEQFDGYFDLEDTTPQVLRSRLSDPGEYWGWPIGVAVATQVLKQADVLQLLLTAPQLCTAEQIAANYDYYAPRTQHGSSLSPSTHAIIAHRAGRDDDALSMFVRSVGTDLFTRTSKVSGGTFIGGIRTAACGAAWLIMTRGFAGFDDTPAGVTLAPRLPAHWQALRFGFTWRGHWVDVAIADGTVTLTADPDNPGEVPVTLWGEPLTLAPGEQAHRAS